MTAGDGRPAWRGVLEVSPYTEVDYITDQSGSLESRQLTGGVAVQFDPDGILDIELHHDLRYRLSWRGVVYDDKRRSPFRSVEQLRYDFERDVAKA